MPRVQRFERTAAQRTELARKGRCIDCGVEARPLRVTGPSILRDHTHHRCHGCYRIWHRRRALWDRLGKALAHARVILRSATRCSVCSFVLPVGDTGFWIKPQVKVPVAPNPFVCRDCHADCLAEFQSLPGRVARVCIADMGLFADKLEETGCALYVRYPPSVPALKVIAERFVYEFHSDFPFAIPVDVSAKGRFTGAVEAYLHVHPRRYMPPILLSVVEVALFVLRANRVELFFEGALRRALAQDIYDVYGRRTRQRLFPGSWSGPA